MNIRSGIRLLGSLALSIAGLLISSRDTTADWICVWLDNPINDCGDKAYMVCNDGACVIEYELMCPPRAPRWWKQVGPDCSC